MARLLRTSRWLAAASMTLAAVAGCTNAKDAPPPSQSGQQQKPVPPLEGRTPDDAYGRPASVSQPSGTMTDPARKNVPADAKLVSEGAGELKFTAGTEGTLFLVNADNGTLIYRGRVSRGQNVKVAPAEQVLQIDNKSVVKQLGGMTQQRKMFFQRD